MLLVQRPAAATRMAGMWELPETDAMNSGHAVPAKFRHAITDTDYDVSVLQTSEGCVSEVNGQARWFTRKQWQKLALTGLARKVLRKMVAESTDHTIESTKTRG